MSDVNDILEKDKGPCVVLAGAGTGKTYTIVEKIKYLVRQGGYDPEKIVCITFSNEAANNLFLRIDKSLKEITEKRPVIRTFHGFSADLLREKGDGFGVKKDFKIIDPDQAKVVLHRNLKINPGNCHKYVSTIGTVKDLGIKIEDFKIHLDKKLTDYGDINLEKRLENLSFELQTMHLKDDSKDKKKIVSEIKKLKNLIDMNKFFIAWNSYEKLKRKNNYLDYSDLNKNALDLVERNPDLCEKYEYLIIDEFQDTNKVQLDFVVKIAKHRNVSVVGDLNQSIYRFRGAYKENLSLFKSEFGVSENDIFTLDKSYRSSNKILRTAHKLISRNYENKDDSFFVKNVHDREGENIKIYELKNAKEEARKVVEVINAEVDSGTPMEEICIMFRTHQYGRVIRRILDQEKIPYFSVAKSSLLKQKSVKTVMDYITIIDKLRRKKSGGEDSWWDLAYQLDFKQKDLVLLGKYLKDFKKQNSDKYNGEKLISVDLFNNLESFNFSDSGKMSSKILIEKIKALIPYSDKSISEFLQEVYRVAGFTGDGKTREEKEALLNLNRFYEIAKYHEELYDSDLDNFLYYLEILGNLGIEIDAPSLEESGVRLMTSHSTKGLEYKTVIITNMAHGRFPIERYVGNNLIPTELLPEVKERIENMDEDEINDFIVSYQKHQQLLEERRLAYVSFTRAKEKLVLTYAKDYGGKKVVPSRFLNEILYKSNGDIDFVVDDSERYVEPKADFVNASEFSNVIKSNDLEVTVSEIVNERPEKSHNKFSPSALLLFDKCEKEFEYKYIYNMPEKKKVSWEAMRLGSFVHLVLEKGVSFGFKNIDEFIELGKEMSIDNEWESINYDEAETLIRVFFERNKNKYGEKSETEKFLPLKLSGIDFIGFADRIDFDSQGRAQIVDYKTGKTSIPPKDRNWQLGFYALAAKSLYGSVSKVTLDMLRQEKPLEFDIDDSGNAICRSSERMHGFNIYDVESEIVETARKIQKAYKAGFKPCPVEKNCEFCNEYIYGL